MVKKTARGLLFAGWVVSTCTHAQAKWELEISNVILLRRKKALLVALLPVFLTIAKSKSRASYFNFKNAEKRIGR
jgi:hypothetical protein